MNDKKKYSLPAKKNGKPIQEREARKVINYYY